jgi:DnaJ-domain-containing protein 1
LDRLFSRLGDVLRVLLERSASREARPARPDPYLRQAEEELEAFLRGAGGRPAAGGRRQERAPSTVPALLRRDYANLEVDPGAPFEEVRRAHRRMIRRYHPDRFGTDPEKQRLATQISQRLNDSFRRIRDFHRASD